MAAQTPAQTNANKRAQKDAPAAEVMNVPPAWTEDELRDIASFDDAVALTAAEHGTVVDASAVMGDGFALLDSERKNILVGTPLLLMSWDFYDGDFGGRFVAVRLVQRTPNGGVAKYILNDGSTGIAQALARYQSKTGKTGGLLVKNGLRASEYTYCEICQSAACVNVDAHKDAGSHKRAATYYLDTTA